MSKTRRDRRARLDTSLAVGHITRVGQDCNALFVINHEGALSRCLRKMIQRGIDPRNDDEEADDEQNESLEKAFHGN